MFLITGVPYKRIVNWSLAKDWGMKISSLYPALPYKWVPYKWTLLYSKGFIFNALMTIQNDLNRQI